jgi:ATP-binding cassette subfamily E protein 1
MTRIAVVDKPKCVNGAQCPFLCAQVCPVNRTGKECIVLGSDNKPIIDESLCIGCGICPNRCPVECIDIINLPEELSREPINRYGRNGFHLYNLPIPIFGKVVGVIGRNGIGKSTALKILAGVMKPNLGREKEATYKELIEYFKGTEAQLFFENVKSGKIKVGYKPQNVDLIPKTTKGKVKTLLKKVDEKKEFDKIVELLELENILDNDISKISGGELQMVAIAATVLKKANFYIFDEPTSYLDIKQRIKVSKFIKNLADENTAVLIVEHDLIILDYMTDLIHLMYGKEGTYGIVSLPKTTRVGINIYLSGYLKEENIRFRDKEIKFLKGVIEKTKKEPLLISWKNINKKLGKFQLTAVEGKIDKHDVIGVLGENGIGKTSFVKILAGVDKTDKGVLDQEIKVAYKPQYLEPSDELVMISLQRAIQKYSSLIMNPLNIKPLLHKKLSELSGGELQKVAVAHCLSQDADLMLLDEPSAYLDVEQRLIVSRVIKNVMEQRGTACLVVDHDLLFIDYLSKKLMVFEGKPAINGDAQGPFLMEEGMNKFLKEINITYRRDEQSNRPRVNKEDSQKDKQQKSKGKYYYL